MKEKKKRIILHRTIIRDSECMHELICHAPHCKGEDAMQEHNQLEHRTTNGKSALVGKQIYNKIS